MQKKLLLLSFIEGAAVMAAELCGAKLLAPVFGSSLYVWASVMGVTLAALASGYFFGGWLSGRSGKHATHLFHILNAAALLILVTPVLNYYLVPRISYLPYLPGIVLSTLALLFLPVFFLGASSPLFILIQTDQANAAGKVSGSIYAISTAGGILATFVCGFYFIPELGLNACLVIFGTALFLCNVLVLKVFKSFHFFLVIAFAYLNFQFVFKTVFSEGSSDSILGHLEIKDLADQNKRPYRVLLVNDVVQSEMDLVTKKSISAYVHIIDTLVKRSSLQKQALVLGLGAGLTANLLNEKNYRTEGVDLDKRIVDAAKRYFYLDAQITTYVQDARYFLNRCDKKYTVIIFDIFKGEEQPSHILTVESLINLKKNLEDSALILINWHGYTSGENGLGTATVYNTLVSSGYHVKLCSNATNEAYRNIVFAASLQPLQHLPYELNEQLQHCEYVNTDNKPLLEKYNARANKSWRLNYLRYYQNTKRVTQ